MTDRPDIIAALDILQRAVDLAMSRGCDHCADGIRQARHDAPRAMLQINAFVDAALASHQSGDAHVPHA